MNHPFVRCPSSQHRRGLIAAHHGDRGSATAELVLLIPVLLLAVWFLVYCSRLPDARLRLEDVAHQATRAASQARSPATATRQARSTAAAALDQAGITCQPLAVNTRGNLLPGSTVTVTVACTVDLHDLALLQLPGTTVLQARFTAPVDVYRGRTARGTSETSPHSVQESP
ncbi:TadE/TadG family type IV pilus assembly protein [Streptomyces sp. NPDC059455]|uniref:TadE/TadG family type IV pilus assembly protein n=1 Tax=Streptomyces sp. NPDC059455 TaxID=3346837 RepID=UPI003683CE8B